MALVPMRLILDEANKGKYGVGAFNVNNMEQLQAICGAAAETKSPVIIQVSRNALKYADKGLLSVMVRYMAEDKYPQVPMALHLDHGPDIETIKECVSLGFTSVMIDGSLDYGTKDDAGKHPARSFEDNVAITKEAVAIAHAAGVSVEGEIGTLGGIEDDTVAGAVHLTNPEEAEQFVKETGVDALALAIGTSHGAYKFPVGTEVKLALDIIDDVHKRVPDTALVMHGSSSVPKHMVDEVNKYGGQVPNAVGVPTAMIQDAIKRGMRKVNIDTDGRLAITAAIRKVFVEQPKAFDPRKYLGPAREAVREWMIQEMQAFGTAGHAGDYAPKTLDDMKRLYAG
ncbi:MAG: ketose-bisphosphate aldolase [Chitinivibrionales bacterium]|nr:ketose-bisphosphate aldolase [Chitinivibrionales bacterium]MBD3396151.1 ketose-bisphosphate aldolase [Chitinivibrionales bacterium]